MTDPWDDRERRFTERPVRGALRGMSIGWLLTIVAVVLVGAISIGLWAFGVFTSPIKGQGDAIKIRESAANRIRAQEGFETLFQDIQAADRVIVISAETLRASSGPEAVRLRAELNGQRQYCTGLVGKYNANARKFTTSDFRAADLPYSIDVNDTLTDCKEDSP